jgi:uncharacterized protein YcaQ
MPSGANGRGRQAQSAAFAIIRRFGYLQLDTVSIAGARSHAIVLHSRLPGCDPTLAEELLRPGAPIFEYWGHQASWIPIELYPVFAFRRRAFRRHPWPGEVAAEHPRVAREIRKRIRDDGPLRSVDLEGRGSRGWWDLKVASRVARGLWSSGELAIRERRNFQRTYDLTERVIPDEWRRARPVPLGQALETLLLKGLDGHGWATTRTLARTWQFRNLNREVSSALERLERQDRVTRCVLAGPDGMRTPGWIRPEDLELSDRLRKLRPRGDRGVLL